MFQVFDNNKRADSIGFPMIKGDCWKTNKFFTFEEAHSYALRWLGKYGIGIKLFLGIPYNYDNYDNYGGHGSIIEIREILMIPDIMGFIAMIITAAIFLGPFHIKRK